MIENETEYEAAQDELRYMEEFLARVRMDLSHPNVGLTMAGIRKMLARLHEELGEYEARRYRFDGTQKAKSERHEFVASTVGTWQGKLFHPDEGECEEFEELP